MTHKMFVHNMFQSVPLGKQKKVPIKEPLSKVDASCWSCHQFSEVHCVDSVSGPWSGQVTAVKTKWECSEEWEERKFREGYIQTVSNNSLIVNKTNASYCHTCHISWNLMLAPILSSLRLQDKRWVTKWHYWLWSVIYW